MRKYLIYNLAAVAFALGTLISCDAPDQELEPIISPDSKPVATFTPSVSGTTFSEGDTLILTIASDKMIDRALTFTAMVEGGTADELDYTVIGNDGSVAVMQPYTNTVEMMIIFTEDNFPEAGEDLQLEIGVYGIAEKYLLGPSYQNLSLDLDIVNVNDPSSLTIAMGWPTEDDFDFIVWRDTSVTAEPLLEPWGDAGATTHNPEVDNNIWLEEPGTYYVGIMDWDAGPFDYTFTFGYPDGSMSTITGTFDKETKTYINDPWTAWGGSYDSYRLLKIVNDGTTFTVTALVD